MQRIFRPGHRHYQRLRAEHVAKEQRRLRPAEVEEVGPRAPTQAELDREQSERLMDRYASLSRLDHAAVSLELERRKQEVLATACLSL